MYLEYLDSLCGKPKGKGSINFFLVLQERKYTCIIFPHNPFGWHYQWQPELYTYSLAVWEKKHSFDPNERRIWGFFKHCKNWLDHNLIIFRKTRMKMQEYNSPLVDNLHSLSASSLWHLQNYFGVGEISIFSLEGFLIFILLWRDIWRLSWSCFPQNS